jgi:hypothetical protein
MWRKRTNGALIGYYKLGAYRPAADERMRANALMDIQQGETCVSEKRLDIFDRIRTDTLQYDMYVQRVEGEKVPFKNR